MGYLIDTHILLWTLFSPDRLPAKLRKILSAPKKEIFVSVISIWEISLKYGLGKIKLKEKLPDEIPEAVRSMGFTFLNLDADISATFYHLPKHNKDPFDRMLAWQAINEKLILLSKDNGFDDYQKLGLRRIW